MTSPGTSARVFDDDGIVQLWPVLFLQRELPGHASANEYLADLILKLEAQVPDLTVAYDARNLFRNEHPAVDWLQQCVHKTAIDYCRRAGVDYDIDWTLQGWCNVNRHGDYHDPHNHPRAYLSGTYYVAVPEALDTTRNRSDVRPGCISFYDPRGSVNMTAIAGDPQAESEHTVCPAAGTILMWPAWLMHFVHPNLSAAPRISISFNLMVQAGDEHRPEQR